MIRIKTEVVVVSVNRRTRSSQHGVALIMVLMIFAILSITAIQIITRIHGDLQMQQALFSKEQAQAYALAGESFGIALLKGQWEEQKKSKRMVDSLGQEWAKSNLKFAVDNGDIQIHITDAQGLFDLNSLSGQASQQAQGANSNGQNPAGNGKLHKLDILLRSAGVPSQLGPSILKWVEQHASSSNGQTNQNTNQVNQNTSTNPAPPPPTENNEPPGGGRRPPGLPPNKNPNLPTNPGAQRVFTDVTELRLIKGMTPAYYDKLSPLVVALTGQTKLNVNTAPAHVLETLGPNGLPPSLANVLVENRGQQGYSSIEQFLAQQVLAGQGVQGNNLGIDSNYFIINTRAQYQDMAVVLKTLVYRDKNGKTSVVWRRYDSAGTDSKPVKKGDNA